MAGLKKRFKKFLYIYPSSLTSTYELVPLVTTASLFPKLHALMLCSEIGSILRTYAFHVHLLLTQTPSFILSQNLLKNRWNSTPKFPPIQQVCLYHAVLTGQFQSLPLRFDSPRQIADTWNLALTMLVSESHLFHL